MITQEQDRALTMLTCIYLRFMQLFPEMCCSQSAWSLFVCAFTKDAWNSMQGPTRRKLLASEHISVALWDSFTQAYGVGDRSP